MQVQTNPKYDRLQDVVQQFWGIQPINIRHLVGYDVSNYLIQAIQNENKTTKYIVKVHKNISEEDYQMLQIENAFLQYINSSYQDNKYKRFPKPLKLNNISTKQQSIKSLHTDKLIIYDISKQQLIPFTQPIQSNPECRKDRMEDSSISTKLISRDYIEQYLCNIMILSDKQYIPVCVRVLQYIQGTMLGQIIAQYLLQHSQKSSMVHGDEYYQLVLKEIPEFIGNYLSKPLYEMRQTYWKSGLHMEECIGRLKNRNFKWHIQSFLTNDIFYKKKHQLIKQNQKRPKWHSQVIQYFVNLYQAVHNQLIIKAHKQQQSVRKSVIYNDCNQWNIVINSHRQKHSTISMIDFGDIVYSYMIQDIALYTLYIIYHTPHNEHIYNIIPSIIQHYSTTFPITIEELKLFFVTVPMRMCLSLCNSEDAMADRPGDEYVSMSQKNGWSLLRLMKQMYNDSLNNQKQYLEDVKQNIIFRSKLFHKIKQACTITIIKQKKQISQQELGQHWTTQQQFWNQNKITKQQQSTHALELFHQYYNQTGQQINTDIKIVRLPGYMTKNYKISVTDGLKEQRIYVLKIYRKLKRLAKYIQMQSQIKDYVLDHSHSFNPQIHIHLPRTVKIINKKPIDQYPNNQYCYVFYDKFWQCQVVMRLLTFVHGKAYSTYFSHINLAKAASAIQVSHESHTQLQEWRQDIDKLYQALESMGSMLGKLDILMDEAVRKLYNGGTYDKSQVYKIFKRNEYEWNFQHLSTWLRSIQSVQNPCIRQLVYYFTSLYKQYVLDNQLIVKKLRKGLQHMDPTQDNCMISNPTNPYVDCIIDFDDIQIAYIVDDFICIIAHCMHELPKVYPFSQINIKELRVNRMMKVYKQSIGRLVGSFNKIYQLNQQQIACIYYLLALRLSMCIVLENRDKNSDDGNEHIAFDLQALSQHLQCLSVMDVSEFQHCIKSGSNRQIGDKLQNKVANDPVYYIHRFIERIRKRITQYNRQKIQQLIKALWSYNWVKIKLLTDKKIFLKDTFNHKKSKQIDKIQQILKKYLQKTSHSLISFQQFMTGYKVDIQLLAHNQGQGYLDAIIANADDFVSKLSSTYGNFIL